MINLRIVIVILDIICIKIFKICDLIDINLELMESFKFYKMYM